MTTALPVEGLAPDGTGAGPVPLLRATGLGKTYGSGDTAFTAVADLTFDVREKEFVSIVGPSGCGKTTLLSCLAGLLPASTGATYLRGERVTGPPEGLSLVFQDYSRSLFPWLTVAKNVALPLAGRDGRKAETKARVEELLVQVGLDPAVKDRYPWQLSGGMQQRVAIARSLISAPDLLIMDEPFASVDAQTRIVLEDLVLELRNRLNKTVLFVTHDVDEAVYLSDRVVVLSKSPARVIADIGIPLARPRNQIDSRKDSRFAELRAEILSLVMNGQRRQERE